MTITANMHRVSRMTADRAPDTSTAWLRITGEKGGETFIVFMPHKQAEMIAEAFDDYAKYGDWSADRRPRLLAVEAQSGTAP